MKKTNTNAQAIVFAQEKDNSKVVTANKYVAHALYTQNKALVESLGGTILKGVGGFKAEFKSVANAKKFIAKAITHINEADYAKARKTEPKAKVEKTEKAPKTAKGNAKPTTAPSTKAKSKTEPKAEKVAPRKAKGNADLTDTQKKYIDICKNSILNRAASAYSIANGGEATTFKALGKTAKDIEAYIPNAKVGMMKSKKWAKAVELGITEDMLG